jgi:glycosyltransferase involved in cell wall biosynthesis
MSKKTKVTVVLISYNHAKYLREAIDSVLNQTFSNFELFIVDDASTDDSWQIINSYSDSRIRAFRSEMNTMYGGDGRKVISEMATGEYIAMHHSDDVWELDKLEKQVTFLDSHSGIGAVFTWVSAIGENSDLLADQSHLYQKIFEKPNQSRFEWLHHFFYYGNALCHPSVLIRRACYEECGLYRYGMAQLADFDMWVRLCLKYEIHVLPEKLIRFRVRENESNASGNRPEVRVRGQFEYLQIFSNYLLINDREEFLKIFPDSIALFEGKDFDIPYALAMTALSLNSPSGNLFGLQLLFNILNDSKHAQKIEKIYGFRHRDFVGLTAQHDVFRVIELSERDAQIANLDTQLAEQSARLSERDRQVAMLAAKMIEIRSGKLWTAFSFLKRIEDRLLPSESRHSLVLNKMLRRVGFYFGKQKIEKDLVILRASSLYDEKWYLRNNPDIAQKGVDPALHYLLTGGFEKRDPGPLFSSNWYLDAYPDVLIEGTNPLLHYLKVGQKEGRWIRPANVYSSATEAEKEWRDEITNIVQNRNSPTITRRIKKIFHAFKNFPRKLRGQYYVLASFLGYPFKYLKVNGLKRTLKAVLQRMSKYVHSLVRQSRFSQALGPVEFARNMLDYRREKLPPSPINKNKESGVIFIISNSTDSLLMQGFRETIQKINWTAHLVGQQEALNDTAFLTNIQPEMIVIHYVEMSRGLRDLLVLARNLYIPILYFCESEIPVDIVSSDEIKNRAVSDDRKHSQLLYETFRACDFALCINSSVFKWVEQNDKKPLLLELIDSSVANGSLIDTFHEAERVYRKQHLPKFSVVSILHGKAEQIETVLFSYFRQSYPGEFEIIFIDDQSLDQSAEIVERFVNNARNSGEYQKLPEIKILKNEKNLGNCISRNRGIKSATGDIVIVIDADCMVNKDFLSAHADAHSFDDCDVVIGPFNIETHNRDPLLVLEEFEENPERAVAESHLQDPLNPRSFVNCITRNFSIKSSFIKEELFDLLFTYSRDPESGFGWEDIEMGYRLYKRGARIKYTSTPFSIHISHPSGMDEKKKPLRSLKNFRRLFEKHPELLHIARRWSLDTYNNILEWLKYHNLPDNEDKLFLDRVFGRFQPPPFYIKSKRPIKILTYRWHVPHQYELYKLPHEFTLITDLGTNMTRTWDMRQRPFPSNISFRSIREINPRDYDAAILHFDENILAPENTRGVIGGDWGKTFKWFMENIKIPKVAICHGTPQFFGQFDITFKEQEPMRVIEAERERLVDFLEDTLVVVNSYQAQREWSFKHSNVIWHGFDPSEFPQATYERGVISPFGPLVLSRPHYRGFFLYEKVFKDFPTQCQPATLYVPEPDILYNGNEYALGKFQNYMRELSRFSIYFNPTLRSPMPRARGEAMLCGLVTVSAKNHDVECFIKNGWNGFFSDDPEELRSYLVYLLKNPDALRKIGGRGRQTAMDVFNHDRYLGEWEKTLINMIG